MPRHAPNLTAKTFGRLTVIMRGTDKSYKNSLVCAWLCKCICGNVVNVVTGSLTSGTTRSCGCLLNDINRRRSRTHGCSHGIGGKPTAEYRIWLGMRTRCKNPRYRNYHNYGGRGIKIHPSWDNFENFLNDMGPRPRGGSIDRINNNGDYEPNNCRWTTPRVQCNNKRNTRLMTVRGVTLPWSEWCRRIGMNYCTLNTRIMRGWTPEEAIYTPPRNERDITGRSFAAPQTESL